MNNRITAITETGIKNKALTAYNPYSYEHLLLTPTAGGSSIVAGVGSIVQFDMNFDKWQNSVLNDLELKGTINNTHATLGVHLPFYSIFSLLQRIIVRRKGQIIYDVSDQNLLKIAMLAKINDYTNFSKFASEHIGTVQGLTDPSVTHSVPALTSREFTCKMSLLLAGLFEYIPCIHAGNCNVELTMFTSGSTFYNSTFFGFDTGYTVNSLTVTNLQMVARLTHYASLNVGPSSVRHVPYLQIKSLPLGLNGTTGTYRSDLNIDFSPVSSVCRLYVNFVNTVLGNTIDETNNCVLFWNTNVNNVEFLVNNVRKYLCNFGEFTQLMYDATSSFKEDTLYRSSNNYVQTHSAGLFVPFDLQMTDSPEIYGEYSEIHPLTRLNNYTTSDLITVNVNVTVPSLTPLFATAGRFNFVLESNRIYTLTTGNEYDILT